MAIRVFRALTIWALVLVALFAIIQGPFIWGAAKTIYQADEGFKRARRTIDPEELRRWALQAAIEHTNDHEIPASEIPGYILNLYSIPPESANVGQAPDGQPAVTIFWGGGFFHWVMEIGDTNLSEPFVNDDAGSDYGYNFEWTNGIYYSREARWKLW